MNSFVDNREFIARRCARMLKNGAYVNLGIGIPTLVPNYVPEGVEIYLQAENGMLRCGPRPTPETADPFIYDAGAGLVTALPGASFFDSCMSFAMIRGGHIDTTIMGGMEVDEEGNLANYMIPGKFVAGMGGAMDLCAGARHIIVAMEMCTKDGGPRLRRRCTLPLTGAKCVKTVVTEKCVLSITPEGMLVHEIAPDETIESLRAQAECDLLLAPDWKVMEV